VAGRPAVPTEVPAEILAADAVSDPLLGTFVLFSFITPSPLRPVMTA
jgi:hypothetical protein